VRCRIAVGAQTLAQKFQYMSAIEPRQKEARECEKYTQVHWHDCMHCDALRQARKTERSPLRGAYRRPRRVDSAYAATRRRGSKRRRVETHFRRAAAAAFARSIRPASRAERPHLPRVTACERGARKSILASRPRSGCADTVLTMHAHTHVRSSRQAISHPVHTTSVFKGWHVYAAARAVTSNTSDRPSYTSSALGMS
jgi:hypothetical protein